MTDLETRVREMIRDHLALDALPERSDNLREHCGADALDQVELAIIAEDVFSIEIDDDRLVTMLTVEDWIVGVSELVKEAA